MVQTKLSTNNKKVSLKVVGLKHSATKVTGKVTVRLVADNNNKFDADAVKVVDANGNHLGFVANNKANKGTLSNNYYKNFKSATDLRSLVNLEATVVVGTMVCKGSYGLLRVGV